MDDDTLYVKIRIRKQIKNKKKLYRASLLTKDKKEKVIGWFVTRAEATNIANITRDRHEKIRLLRAEAMSTTNVNGNVQPKNDIIIINNEATKIQQISNEENSKQIMPGEEKEEKKQYQQQKSSSIEEKGNTNIYDEPFAFYPIPNHLPKIKAVDKVQVKSPKFNMPLIPHPKKKLGTHQKKTATETLLPSMMKGRENGFKILSRRKQRGGRKLDDTEDIKMLVSPQPYVDTFYSKFNDEKDNMYLRTPHTAGFHTLTTTLTPEDKFATNIHSSNEDNVEHSNSSNMTNDTKETKMTVEKTYHREKNIETVHKRLHNLSSYTGIYKRLNYFDDDINHSATLSRSNRKNNNTDYNNKNGNNNKRKRLGLSPSLSRIEYARERNKKWKAEDATSHDILQNKLRTAGSSMMLSHAITNGTRQIVIAPINLSLLTTKKPLLNRSHGSKMYLKNTWY